VKEQCGEHIEHCFKPPPSCWRWNKAERRPSERRWYLRIFLVQYFRRSKVGNSSGEQQFSVCRVLYGCLVREPGSACYAYAENPSEHSGDFFLIRPITICVFWVMVPVRGNFNAWSNLIPGNAPTPRPNSRRRSVRKIFPAGKLRRFRSKQGKFLFYHRMDKIGLGFEMEISVENGRWYWCDNGRLAKWVIAVALIPQEKLFSIWFSTGQQICNMDLNVVNFSFGRLSKSRKSCILG